MRHIVYSETFEEIAMRRQMIDASKRDAFYRDLETARTYGCSGINTYSADTKAEEYDNEQGNRLHRV